MKAKGTKGAKEPKRKITRGRMEGRKTKNGNDHEVEEEKGTTARIVEEWEEQELWRKWRSSLIGRQR
jgi:hypothetical protein